MSALGELYISYKLGKLGLPFGIIINILTREKNGFAVIKHVSEAREFSAKPHIGTNLYNSGMDDEDYKNDFGGGRGEQKYHRFVRYTRNETVYDVRIALCKSYGLDPSTHKLCTKATIYDTWVIRDDSAKFWDEDTTPSQLAAYCFRYFLRDIKKYPLAEPG